MTARTRVRIDRLVVDDAPGVCVELLAAVIIEELTRLSVAGATAEDVPRELAVDLGRSPEAAGRAIAAALHARLAEEVARG